MANVLVTGGAGYIGSHTCKALRAHGFTPITFDNLTYGHRWAVQWGPLIEGDLLDDVAIGRAFEQYHPIAVMHFAAHTYVGESVESPGKYYQNNVAGSLCLLEAMRKFECNQLVFSSTCATYGEPTRIPIDEECPQVPINPYGTTKLIVERMLRDYDRAYGLRSISLRYFNAAGADAQGLIGEAHDPETHLIPLVLDAAADPANTINVFGNDYPTADGSCIRDYIHVTDLAEAHALALGSLIAGANSTAYNLGTGKGTSVFEILESVRRVTGKDFNVSIQPRRPGDPARLVASSERIQADLNWQPKHSALDNVVKTAWQWHQRQRAGHYAT